MKKKSLLMCALAAMMFASCSDDTLSGENGDVVTDPNGDAWIALSIKTPSTATRALHNPENQLPAEAGEYEVANVKAVFFNSSDNVIDVVDFSSTTTGDLTSSGTVNTTRPFQIDAQSKTILIIVNPVGRLNSLSILDKGKSFDEVNAAMEGTINDATDKAVATPKAFLMTNAKGGLEPSDKDGNTTSLTLYKTKEAAVKSPQVINVDHVVAKVRVYVADDAADKTHVIISDAQWVLNVTNRMYFPVSQRTKTWNEDPANQSSGGRGECITPFDTYKLGSYRIDPNYDKTNIGEWDEANRSTYMANYNYIPSDADISQIKWNEIGNAEYCLENTQDQPYNTHAYTTQVLLKANYAPQDLINVDKGTYSVNAGDSWLIVGPNQYSYSELLRYIEKELTNKYDSGNPDAFPSSISTTLNNYIEHVTGAKIKIPTNDEFKTVYSSIVADVVNDVMEDFTEAEKELEKHGGDSYGSVTYYKGGVNYYKIMVKHDDTDVIMNELGEFGVVRNSVYDINIKAFNNPGYPTIPDPDPNTPDEADGSWLSVEINVNPWTWYSQTEEL